MADFLLAYGASPVMGHAAEESAALTGQSDGLLLNTGTPFSHTWEAMELSGREANRKKIPVVLDAVGAGASGFRLSHIEKLLLAVKADVIKGNEAELTALACGALNGCGVDRPVYEASEEKKREIVEALWRKFHAVIIMTGHADIVYDGHCFLKDEGGDRFMSMITGTGCILGGLICASLAFSGGKKEGADSCADDDIQKKAVCVFKALSAFNAAGEKSARVLREKGGFAGDMRVSMLSEIHKQRALRNGLRLYAVTPTDVFGEELYHLCREAIAGGVTCIQYRDKTQDIDRRLRDAQALAKMCRESGVLFIVNDDVALAKQCGADGVHLGAGDGSWEEARRLLGAERILGVTVHSHEEAACARRCMADYMGIGAMFQSGTKKSVAVIDHQTVREICRAYSGIYAVGIGGVTLENVEKITHTGLTGVAFVSEIFGADDVKGRCEKLAEKMKQVTGE